MNDTQEKTEVSMPCNTRREFLCAATATSGAAILTAEFVPEKARASADEVAELVLPPATQAVTPFEVHVPEAAVDDLKRRLAKTRWPNQEPVADWSQGVPLAKARALVEYWRTHYDWRRVERSLNSVPQFRTQLDGLGIHFIHVRSKHPDALPIIMTHGWPGSVIEFLQVIGPLVDPTAHGGEPHDAFHVVVPSLPGFGFSDKPTEPGWRLPRIATAWGALMQRLGYTRYVAQGGDWGNAVTEQMALLMPPELLGIHTNMPATVPDEIAKSLQLGEPAPNGLSSDERHAFEQLDFFYKNGLGYAQEMSHRPQTLYGIEDSPVGLAAWMLDHDAASEALISRVFAGQTEGLTRDDVLENVTLYWLTNTAVSSARLYWESKLSFFAPKHLTIPVAISVFPDEIYAAPQSWTESAYPKLIHFNRLSKGGHCAAWEQPELFTEELRASFKSLRQS